VKLSTPTPVELICLTILKVHNWGCVSDIPVSRQVPRLYDVVRLPGIRFLSFG
jgi:hypothetical protein